MAATASRMDLAGRPRMSSAISRGWKDRSSRYRSQSASAEDEEAGRHAEALENARGSSPTRSFRVSHARDTIPVVTRSAQGRGGGRRRRLEHGRAERRRVVSCGARGDQVHRLEAHARAGDRARSCAASRRRARCSTCSRAPRASGHALKAAGYRVLANDHNAYAATLARCYVQADAERRAATPRRRWWREFNALPGSPGLLHRDLLRAVALLPAEERRADRRHPRGDRAPRRSSPSSRRCCSSR